MGTENQIHPDGRKLLSRGPADAMTQSAGASSQGYAECAARQSAKGVLRDRVDRLRREADHLEALAGALPEQLPRFADEALYDLLMAVRR